MSNCFNDLLFSSSISPNYVQSTKILNLKNYQSFIVMIYFPHSCSSTHEKKNNFNERWFNFVAQTSPDSSQFRRNTQVLFASKKLWIIIIFQTINHFFVIFSGSVSSSYIFFIRRNIKKKSKLKWLSSGFGFFLQPINFYVCLKMWHSKNLWQALPQLEHSLNHIIDTFII